MWNQNQEGGVNLEKEVNKDIKNNVKDLIKRISSIGWYIIPCVIVLIVFTYSIYFRLNAQSTGGALGDATGRLAGRAVGSFQGLTIGQAEGFKAGKEEGLSAKDTTAELATKIQEVEKLEVLVASGNYSDVISIGKKDKPDYAALISQKYNAVFTVNLDNAMVDLKEDGLHILIDQPKVQFVPVGEVIKMNEYIKNSYTGSAEDGWKAAVNSIEQITNNAQHELQTDESMIKAAKGASINQLTQLVNAVSLSKPKVFVEFRGGESDE